MRPLSGGRGSPPRNGLAVFSDSDLPPEFSRQFRGNNKNEIGELKADRKGCVRYSRRIRAESHPFLLKRNSDVRIEPLTPR